MSEIMIPNQGKLFYKTRDEAANDMADPDHEIYMDLFQLAEHISLILQIPCPAFSLQGTMLLPNPVDGTLSKEAAYTYHPEDIPTLKTPIVALSMELFDQIYTTGVIAHELRHIWQKKYYPDIAKTYARGYLDSLMDPAEIDADGFGIWYLSTCPGMDLEKAAAILCPNEKTHHHKAYLLRMEEAKKFQAFYESQQQKKTDTEPATPKRPEKVSVFYKFTELFKRFRR